MPVQFPIGHEGIRQHGIAVCGRFCARSNPPLESTRRSKGTFGRRRAAQDPDKGICPRHSSRTQQWPFLPQQWAFWARPSPNISPRKWFGGRAGAFAGSHEEPGNSATQRKSSGAKASVISQKRPALCRSASAPAGLWTRFRQVTDWSVLISWNGDRQGHASPPDSSSRNRNWSGKWSRPWRTYSLHCAHSGATMPRKLPHVADLTRQARHREGSRSPAPAQIEPLVRHHLH